MTKEHGERHGRAFAGLVLVAVGAWFLLDNLGLDLPGLQHLWPVFPLLGGLSFIVLFFTGRETEPGILIPGVGGVLVGCFFLLITVGPLQWHDLDFLWPVFPLIGGIAFLATWMAGAGREPGLLVPALGGLAVGIIGLLATHQILPLRQITRAWPLVLIVMGLWFVVESFWPRSRRHGSPQPPPPDHTPAPD